MKADYHCGHSGHHSLFPELVVIIYQCIIRCVCGTLYYNTDQRFLLSAGIRFMDKPPVEEQSIRRRFQYRERVFYAGNQIDGKRVFRQSTDQILV